MSSVVCRARFGLSLAHPQAHEWKLHRVTSLGLLQMFVAPKLCCERRGACMMNALLPLEPSFLKAPPYIYISVSCDLFGPGALANDVCDLSAFSRSFSPSSAVCRQIPAAGSRRRLRCPQQTNTEQQYVDYVERWSRFDTPPHSPSYLLLCPTSTLPSPR